MQFKIPLNFWLYWDPTDPYDIKLLQEYVGSNRSVVYQPLELYESTHQKGKIC